MDHLLAIKGHVPLCIGLIATPTDALLVKHRFQIVIEVTMEDRPSVPLILERRVKRRFHSGSWFKRQFLLFKT